MGKRVFRYLSHPQVKIDAHVPVPDWGLSDVGNARVLAIRNSAALTLTKLIVSSGERKAMETASIIAEVLQLSISIIEAAHENDRSATGFLPPPEFEQVATQFFAHPQESIRGWERAVDAQARIVSVAREVLTQANDGDILMVGHGGVGTLLHCHHAGLEISRDHDQKGGGGGNFWAMEIDGATILHGWRPMEELDA
jgi:broad specificity phosphatase PhoE